MVSVNKLVSNGKNLPSIGFMDFFRSVSAVTCALLLHLLCKPRIIPRDDLMVAPFGPLATASREPRQARKGATVVVTLCAEVWLLGVIAISPFRAPVISL